MNEINSFTFFKNYYEVIKELPKEDKRDILESIVDYVFEDKTPNLTGLKKGIWQLIQRPIDISKRNGSNKSKKNGEQMENKSKKNGKKMENECSDLSISSSISNSCSNILENKGYGEKKPFKEIIDYLNKKTNTHFKYNSKTTQSKINARLNEGYVLDDFIAVIDKKFNEWNNTEFEQYLCPETLFGPKFEKYLNQKSTKTGNKPDWLKKDILEDKASDEEIKALEERLKRR